MEYPLPTGETYYRIIKILDKKKPHRASLEQDYAKLQQYARESKRNEYFNNWINEKLESTYIQLEQGYLDCPNLDIYLKE